MFAWAPFDMSGIDTRVMCHSLTISPTVKLVTQIKHKVGVEKLTTIDKDVGKLKEVGFVTHIKYVRL